MSSIGNQGSHLTQDGLTVVGIKLGLDQEVTPAFSVYQRYFYIQLCGDPGLPSNLTVKDRVKERYHTLDKLE